MPKRLRNTVSCRSGILTVKRSRIAAASLSSARRSCSALERIDLAPNSSWDLEAKRSGKRTWELANIPIADQVETSFTISLDTPARMADAAAAAIDLPILKLKLCGDDGDLARVKAVYAAAPNARLLIDANESWSPRHYRNTVSALKELGVELIEQPFPADADDVLETLEHPIPVCADESCHTTTDLTRLKNRYEAINIKLDKTGGLTEALQLYQRARENNHPRSRHIRRSA